MNKEKITPEHNSILAEYGLSDMGIDGLAVFHFRRNEYVFRQGDACDHIFLMLEGRMKVFIGSPNGKTLLFCFYTKSGILGEAEFAADEDISKTSVQAITDVYCIGIPRRRYQKYLKSNAAFMSRVSAALAGKLFRCTRNSAVTILYSLEARLCAYISMTNEGGRFSEKMTEVAEMLGASYRHLLRTLDKLCCQGILQKAQKGYIVLDKAALEQKGDDYYLA